MLLLVSGTAGAQVFAIENHGPPPQPPLIPGPPWWFFSVSSGTGAGIVGGETAGAGGVKTAAVVAIQVCAELG